MELRQVQCLNPAQAGLGESPLWDHRAGLLWWVDIHAERIHSYNPDTEENISFETPYFVSALALAPNGLLAATEKGVARFDTGSGILSTPVHHPEPDIPTNRMNDIAVAPDGTLWVGTMHRDAEGATGSLYRYHAGGVDTLMTDTTISNGLGWCPESGVLYFIDSIPGILYSRTNGEWSVLRRFDDFPGSPDGMTVDAEGTLWVSLCGGGQVIGMTSMGDIVESINLPCSLVTCCAFGGADLRTLFITTATFEMNEHEKSANRLAGGLFSVEMNVPGLRSVEARWPNL